MRRTNIETVGAPPPLEPQPLTPLSKWIARADELHSRLTDFGMRGGKLPVGPCSMTTLGLRSPSGSTRWNGTPSKVFGDQSSKTSRSTVLSFR